MAHHHVYHHTKFRWTENLTCRFIQLRKENGNLFTGRKYSAQAGWEFILQQMREEFPTIMSDVPYRVLKKKWSNLLQQYKELKNPVHGDKNKADDVSWPFYNAIGEFLGQGGRKRSNELANDEDDIDPNEFLYVSVTPDECCTVTPDMVVEQPTPSPIQSRFGFEYKISSSLVAMERLPRQQRQCNKVNTPPMLTTRGPMGKARNETKRKRESCLPHFNELSIGGIINEPGMCIVKRRSKIRPYNKEKNVQRISSANRANSIKIDCSKPTRETFGDDDDERGDQDLTEDEESDERRPRKFRRKTGEGTLGDSYQLNRRLEELFEYIKERDEENRLIMLRILHAVETIANKS